MSEQQAGKIDFNSDESVVRAMVPDAVSGKNGAIFTHYPKVLHGAPPCIGDDWADARKHESVAQLDRAHKKVLERWPDTEVRSELGFYRLYSAKLGDEFPGIFETEPEAWMNPLIWTVEDKAASRLAPASGEVGAKERVLAVWPDARCIQWMVLWPDNTKAWGYQVEGTQKQRVEPQRSVEAAWNATLVATQPPSALHNAGSGKQGEGKGQWTAEERTLAGISVDSDFEAFRAAWERNEEYEPGDHPYEHYRQVAINLQCELNALRDRLAARKVTWRVESDWLLDGETKTVRFYPFPDEATARVVYGRDKDSSDTEQRLIRETTISEVIETKLAGEEG